MMPARELTQREFLELRCQELTKEIEELRKEAAKASQLEHHLRSMGDYNRAIQKMISVHPDLAEEWKALERIYSSITGKELMRTPDEKIFNRRDAECAGCGSLPADRTKRLRKRLRQRLKDHVEQKKSQ